MKADNLRIWKLPLFVLIGAFKLNTNTDTLFEKK